MSGLFGDLPEPRADEGPDAFTRAIDLLDRLPAMLEREAPMTGLLVASRVVELRALLTTWRLQLDEHEREAWDRIQREHGDDLIPAP